MCLADDGTVGIFTRIQQIYKCRAGLLVIANQRGGVSFGTGLLEVNSESTLVYGADTKSIDGVPYPAYI